MQFAELSSKPSAIMKGCRNCRATVRLQGSAAVVFSQAEAGQYTKNSAFAETYSVS